MAVNDTQIRHALHQKRLRKYHIAPDTLVVDELGLSHGKCRADIAVINDHFAGYEIKSDEDSLFRLDEQVAAYSAVFDHAILVVGAKFAVSVHSLVPGWWGVIVSRQGKRGAISFETMREARINESVNSLTLAQLLWKNEAADILVELGASQRVTREKRQVLYQCLADSLSHAELRHRVKDCLMKRKNWRRPAPLSQNDGSILPSAR
jgi:hypothetical protein